MTTPPIPPAMREAAARAWYNLDHKAGTDWWAGASITERALYLTKAEASLAAALGVCDVFPRWRVTGHSLGEYRGEGWRQDAETLFDAQQIARHYRTNHDARGVEIGRLLVVFTPTEKIDDEGSEQ